MARRKHVSARGVVINFDELMHKNRNTIAVGNVLMNAQGDRLGPGGKVIKKVADLHAAGAIGKDAPYNMKPKKAIKLASLKDPLPGQATGHAFTPEQLTGDGAKSPQEVIAELEKKKPSQSRTKRKIVDSSK